MAKHVLIISALLLVMSGFVGVVLASTVQATYIPPSVHPDEPDMCWDEEFDVFYPTGESFPRHGSCQYLHCDENFSMYITECSPPRYATCKLVEDHSKPYPECCPRCASDEPKRKRRKKKKKTRTENDVNAKN